MKMERMDSLGVYYRGGSRQIGSRAFRKRAVKDGSFVLGLSSWLTVAHLLRYRKEQQDLRGWVFGVLFSVC